ncbi:glycosyl hydrolase family 28-related protein [Gemmata sp.]|uniref:glycosyl hydrolase family 28-related protein n=1 Tax=Gemmata sp. TaxID=1914242 RepID=UPI003F6E583C
MRFCPLVLLATALSAVAADKPATSAALWAEYAKNPNAHSHVPNCSFAGYRHSEVPLPEPKVVANVKEAGAKGDGKSDDTAAFDAAIKKAAAAGGGAVLVPAGTYLVSAPIRIHASGVVLRGEGAEKSVIAFEKSLSDALGKLGAGGGNLQWSWCGGLVWIGPGDAFDAAGKLTVKDGDVQTWEYWRPGAKLADVKGPAKRGDLTVTVDPAAAKRLKPGLVMMAWDNPADLSLLLQMAGHEKMKEYDWAKATGLTGRNRWDWPVEIVKVEGGTVTLKQPLRVDVRPEWNVRFEDLGPCVTESGVERLTLRMKPHKLPAHLKYAGWNGVYLNRAAHCWVRDVAVENADNAVTHAAAKNTTVTGLVVRGGENHHATALRVGSHDNLVTKFRIESKPFHGVNTEYLSAGNVWSDGVMVHGTFDSHRAMSFDLLRTNIVLEANDGRPGGAGGAGPFLGARVVHWNLTLRDAGKEPGLYVNQPDAHSLGALVCVRGPRCAANAWAMVPGDKGCLVIDEPKEPDVKDLFQAQLDLRLKGGK